MKSKSIAKVAAIATGLAMATSMLSLAPMAHAAALTSTQVSSILGLLSSFGANSATIANVNAALTGTTVTSGSTTTTTGSACSFSSDLTIGATGMSVTCLQNALIAAGFSIPAGATGYFGTQTRAAVASWQSSRNIAPAVGYFGPISRAAFNLGGSTTGTTTTTTTTTTSTVAGCAAGALFSATSGLACTTTTVAGCAAGAIFSSTTGQACGSTTTTTTGVITTPGVEGTLTVTVNPTPASGTKVYEGDTKVAVLGLKMEAQLSDIKVERVKVQIPNRSFYSAIATKIYVMDGTTVLASSALNSSTVTDEGSGVYTITLSGFGVIVPKDGSKVLTIAVDAVTNFDSTDIGDAFTITIPASGIRGIDGANIDLYAPSAPISRSFTPTANLTASASLVISLNTDSPASANIVAAAGSGKNELSGLELLRFNARAGYDDVTITDLVVNITRSVGTTATTTTAYLYKGSVSAANLVGSASVVGTSATAMTATFSSIDTTVAKDTTSVYIVVVDVTDAAFTADAFVASVTSGANIVAENSLGDVVLESGSATGGTMTVTKIGATFALVGTPTMTRTLVASSDAGLATSTGTAGYTVRVTAVGGDIVFGSAASTTIMHGGVAVSNNTATTTTAWLAVYKNGASFDDLAAVTAAGTNAIVSYSIPSSGVTVVGQNFTLAEGASVDIPVTVQFTIVAGSSNSYAVQINGFRWYNASTGYMDSTSMTDKSAWRTPAVALP